MRSNCRWARYKLARFYGSGLRCLNDDGPFVVTGRKGRLGLSRFTGRRIRLLICRFRRSEYSTEQQRVGGRLMNNARQLYKPKGIWLYLVYV
jgi:hypothetical protein